MCISTVVILEVEGEEERNVSRVVVCIIVTSPVLILSNDPITLVYYPHFMDNV